MSKTLIRIVTMLALVLPSVNAGPFQARLVARDAKVVVHADISRIRNQEMGRYILDQLQSQSGESDLSLFIRTFGFDPRKDLDSVTIYGPAARERDTVVVAIGRFESARLSGVFKANRYSKTPYGASLLHRVVVRDQGGKVSAAFWCCVHSASTVLIGQRIELVKKAVDVLNGATPAVQPEALPGLREIGGGSLFAVVADASQLADACPEAALLNEVGAAYLGVNEKGSDMLCFIVMNCDSPEAAYRVQGMFSAVLAATMLNEEEDPELARIARAVQLSTKARQVRAVIKYPSKRLLSALGGRAETFLQ